MEIIKKQYEIAFTATSVAHLTDYQREKGIKDSIAQPLLDQIIKQRQQLQKQGLKMPEITARLRTEFSVCSSTFPMNPLLQTPGKHFLIILAHV